MKHIEIQTESEVQETNIGDVFVFILSYTLWGPKHHPLGQTMRKTSICLNVDRAD